jgi:hypothetical protein
MPTLPATPGDWLLLAADARTLADAMTDIRARQTMLFVAIGYEKMANHAARLERLNLPMERFEVPDRERL